MVTSKRIIHVFIYENYFFNKSDYRNISCKDYRIIIPQNNTCFRVIIQIFFRIMESVLSNCFGVDIDPSVEELETLNLERSLHVDVSSFFQDYSDDLKKVAYEWCQRSNEDDDRDEHLTDPTERFYLHYLKRTIKPHWCELVDAKKVVACLDRIDAFPRTVNDWGEVFVLLGDRFVSIAVFEFPLLLVAMKFNKLHRHREIFKFIKEVWGSCTEALAVEMPAFKSEENCCVCTVSTRFETKSCSHAICKECISILEWKRDYRCPLCRTILNPNPVECRLAEDFRLALKNPGDQRVETVNDFCDFLKRNSWYRVKYFGCKDSVERGSEPTSGSRSKLTLDPVSELTSKLESESKMACGSKLTSDQMSELPPTPKLTIEPKTRKAVTTADINFLNPNKFINLNGPLEEYALYKRFGENYNYKDFSDYQRSLRLSSEMGTLPPMSVMLLKSFQDSQSNVHKVNVSFTGDSKTYTYMRPPGKSPVTFIEQKATIRFLNFHDDSDEDHDDLFFRGTQFFRDHPYRRPRQCRRCRSPRSLCRRISARGLYEADKYRRRRRSY